MNSYFYDSVFLVFEDFVRFFYSAEWETMGDEWGSVYLSLLYKMKHFFAVASIYTAGLEGEVLAVHIGQRQYLGFVIKCYYCNYGVRACALPSQAEGVFASGYLYYTVGASVVAIVFYEGFALIGCSEQHFWIVLLHEREFFLPISHIR